MLLYAVNFIASSYSAHKYFSSGRGGEDSPLNEREPSYLLIIEMLFRYHWGSVLGGSLMLAFFYFIDLILNFIYVPQPPLSPKHLRSTTRTISASPSASTANTKRKTAGRTKPQVSST